MVMAVKNITSAMQVIIKKDSSKNLSNDDNS